VNAKLGHKVVEGASLLRIYAENNQKLRQATDLAQELKPVGVGDRIGETMLIAKIREGN
jgi:thymidine phosphorylase